MEFLKNAGWRYATKKFDRNRKVSQHDIELIKRSIQFAPSSYGLQLYKVIIIENQEMRDILKPFSWNQNQIIDCSHLFVFCNYKTAKNEFVDEYINLKSTVQQVDIKSIEGYGEFIKTKVSEKSEEEKTSWLKNQTYLALGNLLAACAELKIDTCPMEGFEPTDYNRILNLDEKGLNACIIAAVGYRAMEDDMIWSQLKVRKPIGFLFEEI